MNKEFKKILLKIAGLRRTDQHWILQQLTLSQKTQFNNLHGSRLLRAAHAFRKLNAPKEQIITLPEYGSLLNNKDPLYVAIILEQGQFSWQQEFLARSTQQHEIDIQLTEHVPHLKSATKLHLFQQWQKQLSFRDQLDVAHG